MNASQPVDEKAADGYQLLNLGSSTGAFEGAVTGWLDAYEGKDA